jgi:HlyD family secretion protein
MADLDPVTAAAVQGSPASKPVPAGAPPVTAPTQPSSAPPRRRLWYLIAAVVVLVGAGAGGGYWWLHRVPGLPPGIAFSNGRLEADEIDVDTKFAGRISEILADEGTLVKAGQVVARIDTRDLEAQLAQAQSQTAQAQQSIVQNQADLVEMGSQLKLTVQELQRARTLVDQGYETREVLDERQSAFNVAIGAYHQTEAKIVAATAGVEAAVHNADLIQVNIADDTLVAPKDGPIQYRLTNVGEVLPAGGKVFTMLDVTYVYMDVFLPTRTAGQVKIGDEASIVLDAMPTRPIRATVTFLASVNEFTPKTVETQEERDKLMFRVRVRIDPTLLRAHEAEVRSGLPGLAYVRLDATPWPAGLQPVIGK